MPLVQTVVTLTNVSEVVWQCEKILKGDLVLHLEKTLCDGSSQRPLLFDCLFSLHGSLVLISQKQPKLKQPMP